MAYPTMKYIFLLCVIFFGCKALGCGKGCKECGGISQICIKCDVGYWLHDVTCLQCPVNCLQCSNDTLCINCSEQFWNISSTCSKSCPTSCDDNGCDDVTGHCSGCMPGFFGLTCVQNCSLCTDGLCDFTDGQCFNGCITGYYEDTERFPNSAKCLKCSNNCSRCKSEGICDECDKGYYKLTYGVKDNNVTYCYPCPPTCKECTTTDNCTVCKSGTYGQICQYSCNDTNCHTCLEVNHTDVCTECIDGFIFNESACIPESTCSSNCLNGCDGNYHCKDGCKDGWSGKRCLTQCATPCMKCDEINNTLCTQCKDDFFTDTCTIACNEHCLRDMGNQTCSQKDGVCLNGCIDGYWGDNCDETCSIGCINANCKQSNGSCEACRPIFYGPSCENNCSEYCNVPKDSTNICDNIDGTCSSGCIDGYSGDRCDIEKSDSQSDTNTGSTKTTTIGENTAESKESDHDTGMIIAAGAGAGGGVVVLISGATVIICVIIRKRRNKGKQTDCLPDEEKQTGKVGRSQRTPEPSTEVEKYIYSMPNKPKKKAERVNGESNATETDAKAEEEASNAVGDNIDGIVIEPNTSANETVDDETDKRDADGTNADGNVTDKDKEIIQIQELQNKENEDYIYSKPMKPNKGKTKTRHKSDTSEDVNEVQLKQNEQNKGDSDCLYARPNKPNKENTNKELNRDNKEDMKEVQLKKKEQLDKGKLNKGEIKGQTKEADNMGIGLQNLQAQCDSNCLRQSDTESETDETVETNVDDVILEPIEDTNASPTITEVVVPESDTYYNIAGLVKRRINTSDLPVYVKDKVDEFDTDFKKLPTGLTRTCNKALKPHNRAKNRYNGIYAYDATRVKLHSKNYINANYIEGYIKSHVSYIASLGPTRATMDNFKTFWEMIWQENSTKIIMLTNLEEEQKMKCEQYWPDQNCRKMYGDFEVSCLAENVYPELVIREFSIKRNSDTRQVTQYHYTAWPDKSVPDNEASLVEFRDKVEQGQNKVTGPIVVHCSAGIGRTGAYIALDILIREGKEEESVDIFGCVMALRGQRVNLVQNVEQYTFLHSCVLYALTRDKEPSS